MATYKRQKDEYNEYTHTDRERKVEKIMVPELNKFHDLCLQRAVVRPKIKVLLHKVK